MKIATNTVIGVHVMTMGTQEKREEKRWAHCLLRQIPVQPKIILVCGECDGGADGWYMYIRLNVAIPCHWMITKLFWYIFHSVTFVITPI